MVGLQTCIQHFLDAAAGDGEISELVAKFAAGEAHFSNYLKFT